MNTIITDGRYLWFWCSSKKVVLLAQIPVLDIFENPHRPLCNLDLTKCLYNSVLVMKLSCWLQQGDHRLYIPHRWPWRLWRTSQMEWRRKAGGDKKKERCDNLHEVHSGTRSNLVLADSGLSLRSITLYLLLAIFWSKIKYLDALWCPGHWKKFCPWKNL